MKPSLWIVIVVVTGIVGFLVGYSVSAYTGDKQAAELQAMQGKGARPAAPAPHGEAAPAGYGAAAPAPAAPAGYGAPAAPGAPAGYGAAVPAAATAPPKAQKAPQAPAAGY